MAMDLGLAGKAALVTGGSRGIGRAVAVRLAEEGCGVGICGRGRDDLDRTTAELRGHGVTACGVVADVTAGGEVERFVDEAAGVLGGVDLLVANAGAAAGARGLLDTSPEDWSRTFEHNVGHAVRAIRAAASHLRRAGQGAVVIVASISGWKPAPYPQYAVAKAAEIQLAATLAPELAAEGIRVNAVSPGSILFPGGGWDAYRERSPERFDRFVAESFPFGRLGTPEEIADVVAFLLSARASWVSGSHIRVDGAQSRPTPGAW